ncbi:hypothetical protein PT974_09190 [Cladobotryum mycophilum]|uniref:Uncharacterized protein n=1 Tax=Cladobotryum mycophilum TaxID=491253 RepID=A0ABR0SGL9_9HYPO
MASFTPDSPRPFSLGGLPFELRMSLYRLVLEDTAPRIFELRLPSDTKTAAESAGPRVVPNKGLKPPPTLHAIPEAQR